MGGAPKQVVPLSLGKGKFEHIFLSTSVLTFCAVLSFLVIVMVSYSEKQSPDSGAAADTVTVTTTLPDLIDDVN